MSLLIDTDMGIELNNVIDSRTGEFVSAATVTTKVFESDGVTQGGSDIDCAAVGVSPGSYYGVAPDTLDLTEGVQYVVEVEIDDVASGVKTTIRRDEIARYVE